MVNWQLVSSLTHWNGVGVHLGVELHLLLEHWHAGEAGLLPVLQDEHPAIYLADGQLVWSRYCGVQTSSRISLTDRVTSISDDRLTRGRRHEELEFSVSLGERPRVTDGLAELLVGLVHLIHRPHEYLAKEGGKLIPQFHFLELPDL